MKCPTALATIATVTLGVSLLIRSRPAIALAQSVLPLSRQPDVTMAQDLASYSMSNGIVTARVSKRNGDLLSLKFKGIETLSDNSGHAGGYWSHDATGGTQLLTRVSIDPATCNGDRAEVSIKGISGGRKMGHGPGAAAGGDFPADIEIRYSVGRGESGVYTYCIFDHLPEYGTASMTEARYCAKLADTFDWMSIDAMRNRLFPRNLNEGDKYIYTAVQFTHPAYGWSSTKDHIGFWFINPTVEYLSGGPTKVEFLCHRDTTQVAAPCVHNYWRSSHYGGAAVDVAQGEHWVKVVGPFFIYVNSGPDPDAVFADAIAQQVRESSKWPYDWVAGVDYPHRDQRATVSGQLVLSDPQMPHDTPTPNLMVGLTAPAYPSPVTRPGQTAPREIDWQTDARNYEFWVRGDVNGHFTIPEVRPGKYSLHAFADGVLGEYLKTDVTAEPGKPIDFGALTWTPRRYGRQIWQIGIPNRNGSEFFKAEDYANPEAPLNYIKLFPHDVMYLIGQSDFAKDWYFEQVPHNVDPTAKAMPFVGIRVGSVPGQPFSGRPAIGNATPYSIRFEMPDAPRGTATLRAAICGTGAREIDVAVNGKPAGKLIHLIVDGAITRHSIQGIWYERDVAFDAAMMHQGTNDLTLTVPKGPVDSGVIYDYLRLELNESAKPAASAQ